MKKDIKEKTIGNGLEKVRIELRKNVKTSKININGKSYKIIPATELDNGNSLGFVCFSEKSIFINENKKKFDELNISQEQVIWHEISHIILEELSNNCNKSGMINALISYLNGNEKFVDLLGKILEKSFVLKDGKIDILNKDDLTNKPKKPRNPYSKKRKKDGINSHPFKRNQYLN